MHSINLKNISKTFVERTLRTRLGLRMPRVVNALNNVSLSIPSGKIFGLLGPNGAGKTTLIKILATLILPDKGEASICGYNLVDQPEKVRNIIGFVNSNERSFYWRLSGRQNLSFFASLWDLKNPKKTCRIEQLFDLVDLGEKADTQVMKYSSGQLQRLSLARALLPDPKILLMDEPTRSLDPVAASEIRKFAKTDLAGKRGKTIIWCTHNLEEAREVCDTLAIIHKGSVMATGSLKQMQSLIQEKSLYYLKIAIQSHNLLKKIGIPLSHIVQKNGMMEIELAKQEAYIPALLSHLIRQNIKIYACNRKDVPLESIFEKLVKRE
ncbi:MAG TPA: ABC transporter ATP-binding protein [Desulfobacterales bacterium]|nr:ABC transporter ATP-binding protein [Desulfobacterales bacterium]